jgi:hypothetical protein
MLDLSLGDWRIRYEKVWATVYLVPRETWVLEIYLLKNLKYSHDEFLYNESFNSYHNHIYMLSRIGKSAHKLLACIEFGQPMWDPCQENGHAPKIKITYTHIYLATPTLGVRKNMPFHPKIYLLPWERIQKDY